ncbi:MAG: hypothetical protein LBR55_00700 [Bacteroidales bacterium]|jgi:hypothetical protein|nr:hypothetical protein [Bacteroidales bacterium]
MSNTTIVETDKQREQREQKLEETQKRYVVGGQNSLGHKITDIYVKEPNYVIYEIETPILSQSIRVNIYDEVEPVLREKLMKTFTDVFDEFISVKGILDKASDPALIKSQAAALVALALQEKDGEKCVDCGKEITCIKCAEQKLQKLHNTVERKYEEQFKYKLDLLSLMGICSIMFIVLSFLVYWGCISVPNHILIYVASAGSVGGFLSVSKGIQKINFFYQDDMIEDNKEKRNKKNNIGETKKNNYIFFIVCGFERVFVSVTSALVVYIALMSEMIFALTDIKSPVYILFGFAAGFCQELIPSILNFVGKKEFKKS